MKRFEIQGVSDNISHDLQHKIDTKTKPLGSLGRLEEIAMRIGLIQRTLSPKLERPTIILFAADHGIAVEGVSAYPPQVTKEMVLNFLNEGAAINIFCRLYGINIRIVDAGVNHIFPKNGKLVDAKIGMGTNSFLRRDAMTLMQAEEAVSKGAERVDEEYREGCNIIGFGEMGIGNTSSASVLMSVLLGLPVERCIGRGTGLDDNHLQKKIEILSAAMRHHRKPETPLEALAMFGGFEIAQMCGAMLRAAELKMTVLVDGFIASAALLVAYKMNRNVLDYALFCHQSEEHAHKKLLEYFGAKPILDLGLRLGEGTGCAVAYPIIESAVAFLSEMASFESASVSEKIPGQ